MNYDRKITISAGNSRRAAAWTPQTMLISELWARLQIPARGTETLAEYLNMKKVQQDDLKDVGGFMAGTLSGPRRKQSAVTGRDVLTLDLDHIPAGGTDDVLRRVDALGCGYCVYSTRKHSPAAPRLRVLLPLDRTVSADEYEPLARKAAEYIGIELCDPTTFEASRLMYWPSCCADSQYVYFWEDRPLLAADGLLARYADWRDCAQWPQVPGAVSLPRLAVKQGDPEAKKGVVGAFCRVYDVYRAMDELLPGVYEAVENTPDRYTYLRGSTTGGAVVYDGGKFLYSHHATDPCGGRLVNAFDLVRLHRFGDRDDEAQPGTPTGRLPSYMAMCELARSIGEVADLLAREAAASVISDFQGVADDNALVELGRHEGDQLSEDITAAALQAFHIQARKNLITGKAEITGMPEKYSREEAVNTLPVFLMDKLKAVGVKGVNRTSVSNYLANIVDVCRYNPVLDMLHQTVWDGENRLPELLRILTVSPGSFHGLLIKKWLIQCVALAHNTPGHSQAADGVLVLQGEQRIGKTHLFRRLAIREDWIAEGVSLDMRSKDDIIRATGAWITELGELDSTLKREQASLKAFITQRVDSIRAPYAQAETDRPRRTSFCSTVNPGVFLRDDTGGNRWWTVPVGDLDTEALISLPDSWFIQLWAEVMTWWQQAPQSFRLTRTEQQELGVANRDYQEMLSGEEELRLLLDFDLPQERWVRYSASEIKKRFFCGDPISTIQIGKLLAKIAREDRRVKRVCTHQVKRYLLPFKSDFS